MIPLAGKDELLGLAYAIDVAKRVTLSLKIFSKEQVGASRVVEALRAAAREIVEAEEAAEAEARAAEDDYVAQHKLTVRDVL